MILKKLEKENEEELEFNLDLISFSEVLLGDGMPKIFKRNRNKKAPLTGFALGQCTSNLMEGEFDRDISYYFLKDDLSAYDFQTQTVAINNVKGQESYDHPISVFQYAGIRPKIEISKVKDFYENLTPLANGMYSFTFGSYPKSKADINGSYVLDKKTTGRTFKFLVLGPNSEFKICEREEFAIYSGGKTRKYIESPFNEFLKNSKSKDEDLYYIEPIKWIFHKRDKFAIAENVIYFLPYINKNQKINNHTESLPYTYLKDCLLPSLQYNLKDKVNKDTTETANLLIEKIRIASKMNDCEEEVEQILMNKIYDYNSEVNKIRRNKENSFNKISLLTDNDLVENLYLNLIMELDSIYDVLNSYSKDNLESIKTINNCLAILDNKQIPTIKEDSLEEMIKTIVTNILPSLQPELADKYKNRIKDIFINEKNRYKNGFTSYFNDKNSYKSNSIIEIRKKLQLILENLSIDVSKNYLLINIKKIISGIYESKNDSLENFYFNEIKESVDRINILMIETGCQIDLESILSYDYQKEEMLSYFKERGISNENINNNEYCMYLLMYIIIKLHKIEIELDEYKRALNTIDNYKIYL